MRIAMSSHVTEEARADAEGIVDRMLTARLKAAAAAAGVHLLAEPVVTWGRIEGDKWADWSVECSAPFAEIVTDNDAAEGVA